MHVRQPHDAAERKHDPHANQLENWMHENKRKKWDSNTSGCAASATAFFLVANPILCQRISNLKFAVKLIDF